MGPRGKSTIAVVVLALLVPGPVAGAEEAAPVEACPAEEVAGHGFDDVTADSPHRDAVACLAWWQVARGHADGRYHPGMFVSRAQAAGLVARIVRTPGGHLPASPPDAFDDDGASVHHFAINRLAAVGVVAGRDEERFEPGGLVTRGQMAALAVRAYEHRTGRSLSASRDHFSDDDGSVHEDAINAAAEAGIARGVAPGTFAPGNPLTRAQAAAFLARTLELIAADGDLEDNPRTLRESSDLRSEEGCDGLLGHLKEQALERVGPWGLEGPGRNFGGVGGGVAAPQPAAETGGGFQNDGGTASGGPGHSDTNVQEAGVDEGDLAKTDGQRIVTIIGGGWLRVIDVSGERPRVAGTMGVGAHARELLLHGNRVLVVSDVWTGGQPATRLQLVDITVPEAIQVVGEAELDGSAIAVRLIDDVARVVIRAEPGGLSFVHPEGDGADEHERAAARNRSVVEDSTIEQWLPHARVTSWEQRLADGLPLPGTATQGDSRPYLDCEQVRRPPEFSGFGTVSVLTVGLGGDLEPEGDAVLAHGSIVYASAESLYVATSRWSMWTGLLDDTPSSEIHRFGISDPERAEYLASGKVPGWLLNQFAMSEHDGVLRVATTSGAPWSLESESQVVTLARDGGRLVELGRVGGLGRGERIYAVRFIDELGYVVTFREVDPLYVVDLSDPAEPRLEGELKIPGYSAYLHPVGDGLLLGVGQDATDQGQILGLQVSLFDVTDVGDPRQIHRVTIERAHTPVEHDHRPFLFWDRTELALLPVLSWEEPWFGAVGFTVSDGRVTELGRISHADGDDQAFIERSIVIGEDLYTLSWAGLKGSDLHTLADRTWTPFTP